MGRNATMLPADGIDYSREVSERKGPGSMGLETCLFQGKETRGAPTPGCCFTTQFNLLNALRDNTT